MRFKADAAAAAGGDAVAVGGYTIHSVSEGENTQAKTCANAALA